MPLPPPEVLQAFEAVPDPYLLLSPDLVILNASDAYLEATMQEREAIRGRNILEVFPDNPAATDAQAVENLSASLRRVLETKRPHRMAPQHYDVPRPKEKGGGFKEKYWLLLNTPVLDEEGQVEYIIHKAEDLTEQVRQGKRVEELEREREEQISEAEAVGPTGSYNLDPTTMRFRFSENMYRLVVEHTPDVITRWHRDLRLVFANPAFEAKTGVSNASLLGKTRREMGQPEHVVGPWMEKLQQVFRTVAPAEHFHYFPTPGGEAFFYSRLVPELGPDGAVQSVLAISRDITGRKRAEDALREEHRRMAEAQAVGHVGSFEWEAGQEQIFWSDEMYRIHGLEPQSEPITLERVLELVYPEDAEWVKANILLSRQQPCAQDFTHRLLRPDGEVRYINRRFVSFADGLGRVTRVNGTGQDVTEVKRLEQENLELRLGQQKALLLAILEAQEEERRRISEALHNGVGQILYATKINLEQAALAVSKQEGPEKQAFQTTDKLLTEAIKEVRQVSHVLVPVLLQDFGLEEALCDMCRKFNNSTLRVGCQVEGLPGRLEGYLEVALYRISQELVNNIVKHSGATEASLRLKRQGDRILLQALDNGKGFSHKDGKKKGLGLRTIEDRVKLLNGTLSVTKPKTGTGAVVNIRVPLRG